MSPKKKEAKKNREEEPCCEEKKAECPMREMMDCADRWMEDTFGVFRQTRVEFLKAVRTLIDRQIDHLEADAEPPGKSERVSKIEIQD